MKVVILVGLGIAALIFVAALARLATDDPNVWGVASIVAFAAYPFAIGTMAANITQWSNKHIWIRRLGIGFGIIGIASAIRLIYPEPKVYMVGDIAGLVLVACFSASGALTGAIVDVWLSPKGDGPA